MIAYEVIDIIKNIENNIKEHFIDYINRLVNGSFEIKTKIYEINNMDVSDKEKSDKKHEIYCELKKVKNDLMKIDNNYESLEKYHDWINKHKQHIVTNKEFSKNSMNYDVCCNPYDYLKPMFYINNELENINKSNMANNKRKI